MAAVHGSTLDRLRLDWMEGRVAAGMGESGLVREILGRVRRTFLADGNVYEAALAALDLVIPFLQEGKTAEVRELADEMVTVFRSHDVSREELAALLLFQEAARRGAATAELARQVAASMMQVRRGTGGPPETRALE